MAIAMYAAFLLFCVWVPPEWKRRFVGYGLITDISVHLILQYFFGGDGAGRAGLLFGGVLINITMHVYRAFYGYERLTMDGWVQYRTRRPTKK